MGKPSQTPQPLTPAVFHVLLALSGGPLHGYAIMKGVETDSGVTMGPGTVYGALHRLEEAGWIAVADPASEEPRRGRTFDLTKEGREILRREGERLARLGHLVDSRSLAPDRTATA